MQAVSWEEYGTTGWVATEVDTALIEHRSLKDEFFGSSHQSPLPHEARAGFTGLSYFDPDPDLAFTVPLAPADGASVTIGTTDGQERVYRRAATVDLTIEKTPVTLALYSTGHDGLFLPFRDATSGTESYGAGRYLDLEPNEDGTITIDFNYAYSPFCAYDDRYSCALPPYENWLDVPIRAGERHGG